MTLLTVGIWNANTSTDENPVHTFSTAGSYQISLTIDGPLGQDTTVSYVVNDIPTSNGVYTVPKYIFKDLQIILQ